MPQIAVLSVYSWLCALDHVGPYAVLRSKPDLVSSKAGSLSTLWPDLHLFSLLDFGEDPEMLRATSDCAQGSFLAGI